MGINKGYIYSDTIGGKSDGMALINYLADRYTHSTEQQWRERIEEGRVLLDGDRVEPSCRLKTGQQVAWRRPPWEEPEAPLHYEELYRDDHLLAVAKPAGLPTMPAGGFLENTLLSLVRKSRPEAVPLHRLGRFTSGIVLFGLDREFTGRLLADWRGGAVLKVYRALVSGSPAEDSFTMDNPIGPVPHAVLGTVHAASPAGKPARSTVRVLERRGESSLCEVTIETGRPHQIRIHLAAAGHPLVGDPLYESGGGAGSALPGDAGYHLHAMRLGFDHPATGERMGLYCRPPAILDTSR